jgi:tRNA modification GTPase
MVELTIDFSEEDLDFAQEDELTCRTEEIIQEINSLLKTAEEGRIMREGVVIAITGKPNVGKSSLLNAILKEERAIVTHIPGTTRDTIEEDIELNGVLVRLIDTAGLRKTEDLVERIGVDKSKLSLEKADLVIFVIDASESLDEEDHEIMEHLADKNVIGVRNKIDLLSADSVPPEIPFDSVNISATETIGLDKLHQKLVEEIISDKIQLKEHVVITKARHKQALLRALSSMKEVRKSLEMKVSSEFLAVDLNGALQALGEIVGMTTPDDILNNIFSNFCIGK